MTAEQIKLISDDEAALLLQVREDAIHRLAANSPVERDELAKTLQTLRYRQDVRRSNAASGTGWILDLVNYFDPGTIPQHDLLVLAPYIAEWLRGNATPFDLPAEYDRRIEFLDKFKQRMLSEDRWPANA